ncbi:MAG: hypothetical protein E6G44_07250 [Actinobacteria bacterium]|nr:MAG: hypothetical protein E6G44_07250 [Actinomycetota bacterium]
MFVWHYLDQTGGELGASDPFPDQDAAEGWMGEAWRDLRDRGVEEVVLVDERRSQRVYRMGLSAELA